MDRAKDSQKIKIKKKTKTPRITDEEWNSQKRLSDPVEKKMKEGKRRKKRLLYPLSPTLFNIFINDLALDLWKLCLGLRIENNLLCSILYSDDAVALCAE